MMDVYFSIDNGAELILLPPLIENTKVILFYLLIFFSKRQLFFV